MSATAPPLVVDHPVRTGGDHPVTQHFRAAAGDRDAVEFPTYRLDTVGVPSWWTVAAHDVGVSAGHGYGGTDADARRAGWGEAAEIGLHSRHVAGLAHRRGSYRQLRTAEGADAVVDPPTLCLDAGCRYSPDAVLNWLPLQRLATGETVWVPADMVLRDRHLVPPGMTDDAPADRLVTRMGNGMGAGDTLDRAISHGLGELLQRHGNGTRFRALDTGVVVDLGPGDRDVADPVTRRALASLRAAGVDVMVKLADVGLGVVGLFVVGTDPDPLQPIMVTAAGEAAHPDREVALRKAVLEFTAARSRKAFTHGSLEAVSAIAPPGYLERYAADPAGEEPRALRDMLRWLGLGSDELRALLEPTVLARRSTVPFTDLPQWRPPEGTEEQTALRSHLVGALAAEGLDVLVLDCSEPGADVAAVRVVVPGLEVEIMSYGRIGERGVADLLARGDGRTGLHGIVGLGVPGQRGVPGTAVPVHLTADAEERLGGPAWLDRAAVDRVVGEDLYPLYREPALHAAAVAQASGWAP